MKVLVIGATGFIGRQLVASLRADHLDIICAVRNKQKAKTLLWDLPLIECDFNQDTHVEDWTPRLNKVDCVINCVGVFRQPSSGSMDSIHRSAPIALFKACEMMGVKKIIHISAVNVQEDAKSHYAKTKNAADQYLKTLSIDWVILKPALVYGPGSYGGSSLFRGLSALPGFIPIVGDGQQSMQPIHVDDLAKAVLFFLQKTQKTQAVLYAVGPGEYSLQDLLIYFRKWLGLGRALLFHIPLWLVFSLTFIIEKFSSGPMTTSAIKMLSTSQRVDPNPFIQQLDFSPRTFVEGLQTMPSHTQDRWHARLCFLSPLLRLGIAVTWFLSGFIPIVFIPLETSMSLFSEVGISGTFASFAFWGSVFFDMLLGIATLLNRRIVLVGAIQLAVIFFYTMFISIYLPHYWLDPFGSIVKNIPLFFATLIMMVMGEKY